MVAKLPDHVRDLGRTVGIGANGSVSNLSTFPGGVSALRRSLAEFSPDVVHIHQPMAPVIGWDVCSYRAAPVVGTFHAYSTKAWPNHVASLIGARRKLNQLHARIAVSEAAKWSGQRWFGGHYDVIPNGVDLAGAPQGPKPESGEFRILFVGRAEERKGLPVLIRAFEALAEHASARLDIVGPGEAQVRALLEHHHASGRVTVHGRSDHDELWCRLHEADVLCAPSLRGESFGMVLIEAFAAGTPVVASRIAGYAEVVRDGVDGVLVPPGDPQRLAEELLSLSTRPERVRAMGIAATEAARSYAWSEIAERVENVYEGAISTRAESRETGDKRRNSYSRLGFKPADGQPRARARRLPPLASEPADASQRAILLRRLGLTVAAGVGGALTYLAITKIGLGEVAESVVSSDLNWVLAGTALMIASMLLRAESWLAIARSALPQTPFRRRDVTSATMIGVLMSATLPARLGEPARAMVLARHTESVRETFPVLLGTLVAQTALNLIALAVLGAIIIGSTDLFSAGTEQLFLASAAPILLLAAVVIAPSVLPRDGSSRGARAARTLRVALMRVKSGLHVFRDLEGGSVATITQLGAWGLQLLSCLVLFASLGVEGVGIGAAAAVLFAVNVTAVIPATPSNIGVFQLAVVSVLTTGFGVGAADALAYGIVLQAVEIATAVVLGVPALVREGVTWSDMRMRAVKGKPVTLTQVS
jgi:phosphatidyl-myo-inositol alpha-mannosyltransferase